MTKQDSTERPTGRRLRAVLLASSVGLGFALAGAPAQAQDSGSGDSADAAPAIVITGSRIVRRDYSSNSPIVTIDQSLMEESSTAAIEQNLNKLPQFIPAKTPTAGGDIQPTATNTPGSATVSLRGIGSNRNLVLIDGRRATPGNASGVVDINTIPSAALERVEVITGGASATYGADAVAGVTNFILKKNFVGLELDGRIGITSRGDGREYQISGIMGTDFADGRGNVSLAMSTNSRNANYQRDRKWYTDLWTNPDTTSPAFFLRRPGINFGFGNPIDQTTLDSYFPGATPTLPNQNVTIYTNPDGSLFAGDNFASRGGVSQFKLLGDPNFKVNSAGYLAPQFPDAYLILPLTRYNALARGNYEINDWIGVFGQGLFSKVETATVQTPGPVTGGWGVTVPWGSGVYTGSGNLDGSGNPSSVLLNGMAGYVDNTPGDLTDNPTNPAFTAAYGNMFGCAAAAVGGCTNTQMFQQVVPTDLQALLNARANPDAPFSLRTAMPENRATYTDVTTYNLTAGLKGSIPTTDFTWEAFVSHGESETFARQTGIYSLNRLRAVVTAPNFGQNFSQQGNSAFGGFGASTGTCTSGYNLFDPGSITDDCKEAVRADLKNRSTVRQTIAEANITGTLFQLPAGPLQTAIGASYRELDYKFLNDTLTTQGRSFQDQALGIYPSGDSFGKFNVQEVYGELAVPILRDIPGIQELNLELGGRISDYSTTGTSYTYKVLGDWKVTDWLRVRGGYNRAERAPNVAELYLAPQQTFGVNNRGDVCSLENPNSFSANPDTNPNNYKQVIATCGVLMEQSGDATADDQYYGVDYRQLVAASTAQDVKNLATVPQANGSFGFAFPTLIGNPTLSPEKADTWTAGVVLTSPFEAPVLQRLRLTVDWFSIKVKDAIGGQTVGSALQQCFDPALNPLVSTDPTAAANTLFCQNVPRNQTGQQGNVFITYVNNGRFKVSGIDTTLDWSFEAGPGLVHLNTVFNYMLEFKSADLPTNPMVDYVGTFGTTENGLNNGAFRYRVLTTLGYRYKGASLSLQWQHLPGTKDSSTAIIPTSTTTGAPAYDLFALNATYAVTSRVNFRAGVENLFDKAPPITGVNTANTDPATTGQIPGGQYNATFYDTNGRRFYIGANFKF